MMAASKSARALLFRMRKRDAKRRGVAVPLPGASGSTFTALCFYGKLTRHGKRNIVRRK